MKIENIDIEVTIEKAHNLVREDKQLSATTKSMFEILILIITLLANRLNLNSTNSSKPPSTDPNRKKLLMAIYNEPHLANNFDPLNS